jgi:Ca2+-binding RTX toxin-like protein
VAPGDPSLFNVDTFNPVRTFTPVEIEGQSYGAYTAAGFEDALSRVFGGVHVREATTDAAATGFALGNFVANNFLQPFSGLIFGSDGDDTLEAGLDGFDGTDDLIFGGAGDDLVDTSTSGDGGNTVFGGSGLDELLSGRADRIFGGSGNDTLDGNGASDGRLYGGDGNDDLFAGTGDRLFGGAGDDTLNAVAGGGSNRLYGGDGNDDLFAGTGDRLIGGAGDDGLFAVGSNSVLTGGDGADIFWVVNGELPSTANTVTDFEAGVDTVGVGGLGVSFADLTISQSGSDTTVALLGQTVAIFLGTQPSELSASSFVFA